MQIRLKCEGCRRAGIVLKIEGDPTFIYGNPGNILKQFTCEGCGHTTRVSSWPADVGEREQDERGSKAMAR